MGQAAAGLTSAEVEDLPAVPEDAAGPREVRRDGGYLPQTKATAPKLMSVEGLSPSSSSRSRTGLEIQQSEADALLLYAEQQIQNGRDDSWMLNREVAPADICQIIAKGYLQRRQFSEANRWIKKAITFAPESRTLREVQHFLQKGGSSPQDIIDLLDRKHTGLFIGHDATTYPGLQIFMDFVSLVTQGGLLWKAWVACHYERRLKRQDYLNADVKATCNYIIENVGSIPLRCLGHLMLGILRLLLRQAGDLENRAEEVRSALQFSLSTGPGLPTVPTVSAASVTLRHPGVVPVLDFGDAVPGLDMLMEPELPDLEVEASLEEGRRHVAPLATITLSSGPTAEPIVEIDDFGAPSAEDQASMAAVGQSALQMVQAVFEEKATEPPASPAVPEMEEVRQEAEPEIEMEIAQELSAEEVPPLDFLLGASSPGLSPPRSLLSTMEGEGFGASNVLAAEKAAEQAEGFAREAIAAAEEVTAILRGEECSDLPPMDFLLRAAPEVSTSEAAMQMKMLLEPQKVAEEVSEEILQDLGDLVLPDAEDLDLDVPMEPAAEAAEAGPEALEAPEGPEGRELQQQEEMQIVPRRKRRRRSIWFDEKTQISDRAYNNTSKITRANPFEYGIFLPHQSYHVGLTTAFGDLCPVLCDPLRRASEIGARQRKARAEARVEEADVPSPPRVPLAADELPESRASAAAEVPQASEAEAQSEGVMQPLQEAAQESAAEAGCCFDGAVSCSLERFHGLFVPRSFDYRHFGPAVESFVSVAWLRAASRPLVATGR
eukprot:s719_g14.t1